MAPRYPARIDFTKPLDPWVASAIATQRDYAQSVRLADEFDGPRTIAGVDVAFDIPRNLTKAAIAVFEWPSLELRATAIAYAPVELPYISGLLAFREIPAILKALACLTDRPDILMIDGQGIAHPRRLGIAAHLGVVADIPAFGVAKSRLCGRHDDLPLIGSGSVPLYDRNELIGGVLRSKDKCNPLYVSAGHRITHETAMNLTRACLRGYRLPEPTRLADQISKWSLPPPAGQACVADQLDLCL